MKIHLAEDRLLVSSNGKVSCQMLYHLAWGPVLQPERKDAKAGHGYAAGGGYRCFRCACSFPFFFFCIASQLACIYCPTCSAISLQLPPETRLEGKSFVNMAAIK